MEEQYIVSARKYRPDRFDNIVGQEALTHTLKTAILSHKMAHAYLFCGPRGVGKTTAARVLAKTINCLQRQPDGEACNQCESCKAFNEQRSLNIYELDAASNNSVEDIRQLISEVHISPALGQYKVYIIDEVHMLSQAAFNAFLKTLEEPPEHVVFILATTEKHKILPTILSRCQIYDFRRITVQDIANHLHYVATAEGIEAETEALNVIAEKADGGMRDALSLFDRIVSYSQGKVTYEHAIESLNILDYTYYFRMLGFFLKGDYVGLLSILDELLGKGFDGQVIVNGLASFLRDLMVVQHPDTETLLEKPDTVAQQYKDVAKACAPAFLFRALKLLTECDLRYRESTNKRLHVELTLMQIAALYSAPLNDPSGLSDPEATVYKAQTIQPQPQATRPSPTAAAMPATPTVQPKGTPQASTHKPAVPTPQVAASTTTQPTPAPTTQAAAQVTPTPPPYTPPKPAPATANSGATLRRRSKRLSIKGLTAVQEEARNQPVNRMQQLPEMNDPVDEEQMQMAWVRYTNQHIDKEQTLLIMAMGQTIPTLTTDDNQQPKVLIELPNFDIEQRIQSYLPDLNYYFCTELKNSHITLETRVNSQPRERKPITNQEKIAYLEKNFEIFDQLRKGLDLQNY